MIFIIIMGNNAYGDDEAPQPAEAASFTLLKEQLVDVLKTLTPREAKALRKLRHPSRSKKLKDFLN